MSNILFITHDCSLSGAPLLLLHTIKWLRKNTTIQPIVLCLLSGPLYTEFSKIAHTFIFEKYAPITPAKKQENEIKKFFKKFFKKNASKNHHFIKHITDNPVSIIHGNTVIAGNVYQFIRQYANAPIISHLHELSGIINQHPSSWKFCLQYSDFFLGGSKACLNNLRNLGVATSKSGLCYDAIDIQQFLEKASIYQKSSYQQEYFTIGFCAHLFYRKGVDIFFQLIKNIVLEKHIKDIHFTWIGVEERNEFYQFLKKDLAYFNLEAQVTLLPISDNPFPVYNTFDIFVLPSREDPFPLVCLENAALGKPIICFADAGGMPEFVGQGAGTVVEYLNVEAMAEAILAYKNNHEYCQHTGKQAAELVQQFDINQAGEIILETYSKLGVNLQRTV